MDVKQHNQDIKNTIAELSPLFPDGFCMVISMLNRDRNSTAGRVVEVSVAEAGKLIVENTHRLATSDEIDAFKSHCANEQKRIEQFELKRAGQKLRIVR